MSQNYSNLETDLDSGSKKTTKKYNLWMLLIIPSWVVVGFYASQVVVIGIMWSLGQFNVPLESYNQTVLNTLVAAIIYVLTLVIVTAVPYLTRRHSTNREDVGLTRLPMWSDIFLTPAALIAYLIFSSLLILLATHVLPGFDINQVQVTGFGQPNQRYEYILAFITLVIIAPAAEEVLFRGYLYGKLKKFVPVWVAIIATSILFGSIHGAWNVAIDTFALSIVLCLLRESTGNIWASILLHMVKNGIAYYILFIYPTLMIL